MYNPYDPYAQYQSYNDPQPEHYAAGVPAGMPQPARPSAFSSAEPAYASHYGNPTNLYETPYGSQPYGSQPYGSQQPSYYPANPASTEDQYTPSYGSLSHSASNQYPPLAPQPSPSLSHAGSHHYPPPFGQSTAHQYPPPAPPDLYSSGGYSTSHSDVSAENPWAPIYLPRKEHSQQEERLQTHAIPKRDDKKENVSFSVDEAQAIIKQLKETIKSLNLQLTNSRDSSNKVVQEKDAKLAQLQNEMAAVRSVQAQAVDPREAVAAVEREWTQRVASKEQEIIARTQRDADAMAETLLKSQQENALLLARISKLQSDADSGRAFLLETNAALEAELVTRRDAAGQQDAEVVRLKDETEKQEAELMKLREETNKLFDEITQMVDEKEHSCLSLEQLENKKLVLEGEKHELEAQLAELKDHSEGYMAEKEAGGAEKSSLLGRIAALEQELEECRDLCEDRRQRIESLENEELPTLNSQLDLMATLDEKARQQIAELEEKLEDGRHAVDALEKQLNEAQKQEMENSLRVAAESRSASEELQRLRLELDHHVQGKSENEKSVSELESQKRIFEQRAAQVEDEKKEAVERYSALEKSLKDVTAAKEELEEEMGIIRDTLDRETEENEEAQNEFRLQIEKLEEQIEKLKEQVSTLTTAKSTLETRVAESEDKVLETKRILQATEDMLKVLKEDLQQMREQEATTANGAVAPSEEKAVLEETLAKLKEKNAQIAKLTERAHVLEEEKRELCNKMDGMEKYIVELENLLAEKDDALADTQAELLAKKRLEREVKGLRFDLGKENTEIKRLKAEVEELTRLSRDANGKIFDLEVDRAQLEEKTAALLEDKKRDSVKASQMGEDILKLETENKELNSRVSVITSKFCDIVAERDELVQTNRNLLRNK